MAYEWNVFLDTLPGQEQANLPPMPPRIYARIEGMEPDAKSAWRWMRLDGIDADWFDQPQNDQLPPQAYFRQAPLVGIEFDPSSDISLIPLLQRVTGAKEPELETAATGHPELWLEINLQYEGGVDCEVYMNLRAPPIRARLAAKYPPSKLVGALRKKFDLSSYFKPAPAASILQVIRSVPKYDSVVVYDVGQGSAAGLTDVNTRPVLYADVGGGVTRNSHTFPTALKSLCACTKAPVVLSHWDWDHWSSAGLRANLSLRTHTWIAPMQVALGPSHISFAQALSTNGKLLLWSAGPQPPISDSRITLERCTGPGRNYSGIAMKVAGPSNTLPVLFPGDASYPVIPGGRGNYDSVIVPHHGADMSVRGVPKSPGKPHSRAVYSYGPGNSFGKKSSPVVHPATITRHEHDSNGWADTQVSGTYPGQVRQTEDRDPIHQLGHVFVTWKTVSALPATTCLPGNTCNLSPTQS